MDTPYYAHVEALSNSKFINWLFPFCISQNYSDRKQDLMLYLKNKGIDTRPFFYPLHEMEAYSAKSGNFPNAQKFSDWGLNLPTYFGLSNEQIDIICAYVDKFFSTR